MSHLQAYIESLPEGLDSHPDATAKAGILDVYLKHKPLPSTGLPDVLVELIERPPPVNVWLPEVHLVAFCMAYADHHFSDNHPGFMADERVRASQLFQSTLYRALMWVSTPRMLINGAATRFARFHLGSSFEVTATADGVDGVIRFPHGLFSELFIKQLNVNFAVLLEGAGAKDVKLSLMAYTPEAAQVRAVWH